VRELRNLRDKRFKKRRKGVSRWAVFFLILLVTAGAGVFLIVSKEEKKPLPADLTSGQFYMKGRQQGGEGTVPPEGKKAGTEQPKPETPVNPESFTFYKVLNSKEGEIVPLTGDVPKSEKERETEIRDPQQEKILQMEKEIGRGLEKRAKNAEVYTVQVAALSAESKAAGVMSKLKREGYESYLLKEDVQKGSRLYKVRVGRFVSRMDAQEVARLLKRNGYETYVIKAE